MPEPSLNGTSREQLQQALLAAYPGEKSLAKMLMLKMEVNLEEVSGGGGTLRDKIFDVIAWADTTSRVEELLRAALAGNPTNARLADVVGKLLRGTIRSAHEYLTTAAFDLEDQETRWRRALASSLEKRLLVLVLRDVDAYVRDSVIRRLERRLTDTVQPRQHTVTLKPTIASTPEAVERVGNLKSALAERHVLCIVLADGVATDVVDRFFQGVRERLSGVFTRHIVILVSLTEGCALPGECVEIPAPVFEDWHLTDWVQRVTGGKGWPPDLVDDFSAAIMREARFENTLAVGRVYDVLTRAIELLSTNPDPDRLRERFRSGF